MILGLIVAGVVVCLVFIIWAIYEYTPRSH